MVLCRQCKHTEADHAIGVKNPLNSCTSHGCMCRVWQPDLREAEMREKLRQELLREMREAARGEKA